MRGSVRWPIAARKQPHPGDLAKVPPWTFRREGLRAWRSPTRLPSGPGARAGRSGRCPTWRSASTPIRRPTSSRPGSTSSCSTSMPRATASSARRRAAGPRRSHRRSSGSWRSAGRCTIRSPAPVGCCSAAWPPWGAGERPRRPAGSAWSPSRRSSPRRSASTRSDRSTRGARRCPSGAGRSPPGGCRSPRCPTTRPSRRCSPPSTSTRRRHTPVPSPDPASTCW